MADFRFGPVSATVGYGTHNLQVTPGLGLDINKFAIGHYFSRPNHGDVAHLFVPPELDLLS